MQLKCDAAPAPIKVKTTKYTHLRPLRPSSRLSSGAIDGIAPANTMQALRCLATSRQLVGAGVDNTKTVNSVLRQRSVA